MANKEAEAPIPRLLRALHAVSSKEKHGRDANNVIGWLKGVVLFSSLNPPLKTIFITSFCVSFLLNTYSRA